MTHHYQEGVPRLPGATQGEFLRAFHRDAMRAFQRDVMPGVRRGLAATVPAPPLVERLAVALWDEDEQAKGGGTIPWQKAHDLDHEEYMARAKRILERVLRG